MTKKITWDEFKQTGDIYSYLRFKEVKNIEENVSSLNYSPEQHTENTLYF